MTETKSIKGIVHSADSGKPLEGLIVMITGGSYEYPDMASQTDEQGEFHLPEIKIPGTYNLLLRHGDQSKTIEVHLNRDSVISIIF